MALTLAEQRELDELEKEFTGISGLTSAEEAELAQLEIEFPEAAPSLGRRIRGVVETATAIGSAIVAEPAAGIAGLGTLALTQDPAAAAAVVKGTRERLTFEPGSKEAQENLAAIGETIAPAAEALTAIEEVSGQAGLAIGEALGLSLQATAAIGAAGKTIPTALLEVSGFAIAKSVSKLKTGRELSKAIKESTPSPENLKDASRVVFNEIDDLGATVKPDALAVLTGDIERAARSAGGSPRTTKSAFGVIDDFKDVVETGKIIGLDELDQLRTVANNAAKTIDPAQKAPALAIIDEIDTFLDNAGPDILNLPKGAPSVGAEYRAARKIWGRARKGELLDEAFIKAKDTASGFENGLRIEFRKILKNKRQNKFFTADEKAAMRQVSEGTRASNLAKLIGRLGISEGQAINIINPAVAGGAAAALFGTPAGIAVPVIGQVSKQLAQKLTRNNGILAQRVIQAGNNAETIAKAYLQNTPKSKRSVLELAELLTRNEVDLATATSAFAKDAADIARQARLGRTGASIGGTLRPEEQ